MGGNDAAPSMRMTRYLPLLILLLPSLGHARQAMIEGARQRLVCDGSERTLVAYLVMQRNAGVPVETLIDKASRLSEHDGERAIAQGRIRDVYLDTALTVDTVTAYRTTKCAKGRLLRDDGAFAEEVRDGLLACQAQGSPGDRAFRSCIGALLGRLDAHAEQAADRPCLRSGRTQRGIPVRCAPSSRHAAEPPCGGCREARTRS